MKDCYFIKHEIEPYLINGFWFVILVNLPIQAAFHEITPNLIVAPGSLLPKLNTIFRLRARSISHFI